MPLNTTVIAILEGSSSHSARSRVMKKVGGVTRGAVFEATGRLGRKQTFVDLAKLRSNYTDVFGPAVHAAAPAGPAPVAPVAPVAPPAPVAPAGDDYEWHQF